MAVSPSRIVAVNVPCPELKQVKTSWTASNVLTSNGVLHDELLELLRGS